MRSSEGSSEPGPTPGGSGAPDWPVGHDALVLVGQHGVYCRSDRFPGKPKMDIALVLEQLDDAKQLVQSAMETLKKNLQSEI